MIWIKLFYKKKKKKLTFILYKIFNKKVNDLYKTIIIKNVIKNDLFIYLFIFILNNN